MWRRKHFVFRTAVGHIKARAAGKRERDQKVKNPARMKPCGDFIDNNRYDINNPHSGRRSKNCPAHIANKTEYIEDTIGRNYRTFVKKNWFKHFGTIT